jgi:hypothetical protein
MEKVSREVKEKGQSLLREGRVKREVETDKRTHFIVQGETDVHSVIFDKERNEFTCDCRFSSLKKGVCSHVYACQLKEKEKSVQRL